MKGVFAILLIAFCLAFPGNVSTGSMAKATSNSSTFFTCNCIYCSLTPPEIIEKAADEANQSFDRAWTYYCYGWNTITPLPCGWRVSLLQSGGGFVLVDLIDNL